MSLEPFKGKIHIPREEDINTGKTWCGLDASTVKTVAPKQTQHADCKTCHAAIQKRFA